MDRDNTPVTEKTMWTNTQDPNQSRSPKPSRKIPSDWSDSEDGKDDQARAKPINVQYSQPSTLQDPQPSTSFASHTNDTTPLR